MIGEIYRFQQRLCYLLLKKHRTRKQCVPLVQRFLKALQDLSHAKLAQLVQLGETLACWSEEIARMWRFTRNNGITEGFHTKMEVLVAAGVRIPKFSELPITGEGDVPLRRRRGEWKGQAGKPNAGKTWKAWIWTAASPPF